MKVAALLPMKARSSRVPGKNFRSFAGKPLFSWILDSLLSTDFIDQVVINTDARGILKKHGLEESDRVMIRDRKAEICGDDMSMNRIIEDDVENVEADVYIMTHTTNPLISTATIQGAYDAYRAALHEGRGDSLFTVNRYQTRFYRADGSAVNHDPDVLLPTQELEVWYEENSCLYLFSAESFAETGARIGGRPVLFETPKLESADIDTETEWHQAEISALSRLIFQSHSSFESGNGSVSGGE